MPAVTKTLPFTMGCDPEFTFIHSEKRASAQDLFQMLIRDTLPLVSNGYKVGDHGDIGWDGAAATGEVRPKQNVSPKKVIENLQKLFDATIKDFRLFSVTTQSSHAPIGGHIHIGLTEEQQGYPQAKFQSINKILSTYYIPLLMGDDPINLRVRMRNDYGKITDFRTGDHGTFEFRAPSAEWLTTPEIAEATLAFFGVLWHEIDKHPETFKQDNFIYKTNQQGSSIQELIVNEYDVLGKSMLKAIKKRIRTFELYPMFSDEIELIINHEKVRRLKKEVNYDIRQGWKIAGTSTMPTKRAINNKTLVNTKLLNTNVDFMMRLINFSFNQDTNVSTYASELKKRVIAFDWKLKNNYSFFGMRKGVDNYMVKDGNNEYLKGANSIKTTGDKLMMDDLFSRMSSRLSTANERRVENRHKSIIIGIPYKDRIMENTTDFINIIHDIERRALKPVSLKIDSLIDNASMGTIYDAYQSLEPREVEMSSVSSEMDDLIRDEQYDNDSDEADYDDKNNKLNQ